MLQRSAQLPTNPKRHAFILPDYPSWRNRPANLAHLEMRYLTSHSTDDILNQYASLDPVRAMNLYFDTIRPLLGAIRERAVALGLPDA